MEFDLSNKSELAKAKRDFHPGDRIFGRALMLPAYSLLILLVAIALFLLHGAWPSIQRFGLKFVFSSTWDPVREVFGALPVIYGTIVSSSIAVLIAAPVSIGAALFLNELAPRRVSEIVGHLIEMLAAIPSVVFGLWGIFVLAPWLRSVVEPALGRFFGFLPLFQGPPYGVGMLAAGLILAIMIMPTVASISREVFHSIPRVQREAALALGATRWEMIRLAVLSGTKSGVFGAVILGLGRALGETMAVTMVIGNRSHISASLFAPAQTMASAIANEYAEATSDIHLSALVGVGLTLFVVTFIINAIARIFVWRTTLRWSAK
ncbi:MAG: phosphate ABC transporter permease subunit PstC [Bdellovibrionales bacterium RIFOXYC1_FULL_54_43]|nr:MAG: phosphate ABC transporter permease subunit PstC [Bdellovibrionales bacterium RIFOXYC1_FULL_54_43]OFZ80650.1 MAG: phosphate ABC transporter permease subunit PstC [Bdellovibrionales bacterium RIFOXYD1_FULL_55_31]